jgi:hypothetical protein
MDNKVEQAAREVENKQETEKLITLQRKEVLAQLLAPSNLLGLLSLYVVFVGTVVAFGVLAFYTGHKTTQEIVFFISAILFLFLPIGALSYLLPIFIKKDALGKLLNRINQSSVSKFLARIGNNRIFRLSTLMGYAYMIADAIYAFPKHPRLSLTIAIIYVVLSFWSLITWASEALGTKFYETLNKVVDLNEQTYRIATAAYNTAMGAHDFIQNTEPSHDDAHRTTVAAIRKIIDTLESIAATVKLLRVDASSKEVEKDVIEDDR